MTDQQPYVFISYSHQDRELVDIVVSDLKRAGIRTWRDTELHAGDNWTDAISSALKSVDILIIFVSLASLKSQWVMSELGVISGGSEAPIIPAILEMVDVLDLPNELRSRLWVDFTKDYESAINKLIEAIYTLHNKPIKTGLKEEDRQNIVTEVAKEAKANEVTPNLPEPPPDSVFIVHGHDVEFLEEVKSYLQGLGITPVVLSEQANKTQALFDKFWEYSALAKFAIILLSADDLGAAKREYREIYDGNEVRDKALKYRARQNVVLEMGFFYGRLGTEKVFVLLKNPDTFFPDFQRPSDLDGILFDEIDKAEKWKIILRERLVKAGFAVKG